MGTIVEEVDEYSKPGGNTTSCCDVGYDESSSPLFLCVDVSMLRLAIFDSHPGS